VVRFVTISPRLNRTIDCEFSLPLCVLPVLILPNGWPSQLRVILGSGGGNVSASGYGLVNGTAPPDYTMDASVQCWNGYRNTLDIKVDFNKFLGDAVNQKVDGVNQKVDQLLELFKKYVEKEELVQSLTDVPPSQNPSPSRRLLSVDIMIESENSLCQIIQEKPKRPTIGLFWIFFAFYLIVLALKTNPKDEPSATAKEH